MTEFLVFKRQIILGFKRDIWSVFSVLLRQILEMNEGGIFNPPHFLFCVKTFADCLDGQVNNYDTERVIEKSSKA